MAKLNIVGVGPGSADYVTPAARIAVQKADVVVGSHRSISLLSSDINGEAVVFNAKTLKVSLSYVAEMIGKGKTVALLSTGDPGFSGLLHTVMESGLFNADDFEVTAGISSIQACAARLKINWETACLFTYHDGNVAEKEKQDLLSCLRTGRTAMILPDQKAFNPQFISEFLLKSGLDSQIPVYICENLTLPEEKVTSTTLGHLSGRVFESLSIMVIKQ